jgi:CRISPR system Cascade subunit CasD
MRSTLLLRLAGPLQSWGTSSRYTERDTGYEPSKSGVIGILAAALGRPRTADVSNLAVLTMGVRVDQEGVPGYDFQSAGAGDDHPGIAQAMDKERTVQRRVEGFRRGVIVNKGAVSISRRHFLQDAVFLIGLEGDDVAFLHELDAALRAPVYPIGLGRRGYVPSVPVAMPPTERHPTGVREGTALEDALRNEPWPVADLSWRAMRQAERQGRPCRLVLEADETNSITTRNDQPIGAAFSTRVFGPRPIRYAEVTPPLTKEPANARS